MNWESILYELNNNSDKNIPDELLVVINSTNRIFLTGFGRSGLALQAFAMRLAQLGKVEQRQDKLEMCQFGQIKLEFHEWLPAKESIYRLAVTLKHLSSQVKQAV